MGIVLALKVQKNGKRPLRGNDHFWSVIMDRHQAGLTTSIRDVDGASNVTRLTVRNFMKQLAQAGLIEQAAPAASADTVQYRPMVIQSTAPRIRKDGTVIESQPATRCMWNLIRGPIGRGGFTAVDLVRWAQTDETTIALRTARAYVYKLLNAGYLILVEPGRTGKPAIYRLDPNMNTGPQAPMILRTRLVFDPNRQEVFGASEAEEVSP